MKCKSIKIFKKKDGILLCKVTSYDKQIYNAWLKAFKKNKNVEVEECDS